MCTKLKKAAKSVLDAHIAKSVAENAVINKNSPLVNASGLFC